MLVGKYHGMNGKIAAGKRFLLSISMLVVLSMIAFKTTPTIDSIERKDPDFTVSKQQHQSIIEEQVKVALVLPFVPKQLDRLLEQMENLLKFPYKNDQRDESIETRLILYTDRELTFDQLDKIQTWWNNSATEKSLFKLNWSLKNANLPAFLADKHPCGPCSNSNTESIR